MYYSMSITTILALDNIKQGVQGPWAATTFTSTSLEKLL